MMWYLSRTPHSVSNAQTNYLSNFTVRNSIFPVSGTGIFEEICVINVPNIINNAAHHKDQVPHMHTCNSWEWFAYQCSPKQFRSVAVPPSPSFIIQMVAILPDQFLCLKLAPPGSLPLAILCNYSRNGNSIQDVPKMHCEDRNLIGAAAALLNGCLYLAGGYKGCPSYVEPSAYMNLAEGLNLKTWEWQALPPMKIARAFATGLAYKGRFYVVGGSSTLRHSAEIYNPTSNKWLFLRSFVPKEADGFAVASLDRRLLILTWSDQLGVKLWQWTELPNPLLLGGWRLISYFPNQQFERVRIRRHGARMVHVGEEVWVMVGESDDCVCKVDGSCAWPVFPAPMFRPKDGCEVTREGHIHAFSFGDGVRVTWRQIPVYSI